MSLLYQAETIAWLVSASFPCSLTPLQNLRLTLASGHKGLKKIANRSTYQPRSLDPLSSSLEKEP